MGKVLIVEDEFIIAQDLRRIVTGLGYAVMGMAKSADEALKKLSKELPDLVLLDINLIGDVKGTELAVTLRDEYGLNFIYVTSFSDPETLQEMTQTKPPPLKPKEVKLLTQHILLVIVMLFLIR